MASGVRDPAFWKRFSTAIHLDEETGNGFGKPELKQTDSWLARQNAKKNRRARVCWAFWICFLLFVAGVIAVVIWLLKSGILEGVKVGAADGQPEQYSLLGDGSGS